MGPKDIEGSVVAGGGVSTAFTTPGGGSNSNPRTSTSIQWTCLGQGLVVVVPQLTTTNRQKQLKVLQFLLLEATLL